nr:hypothetical protein [Lysinibacillus timonensis]
MSKLEVNKTGSNCACSTNQNVSGMGNTLNRHPKFNQEEFASEFDIRTNQTYDSRKRIQNESEPKHEKPVSERTAWN